jgi:hypothetical protein
MIPNSLSGRFIIVPMAPFSLYGNMVGRWQKAEHDIEISQELAYIRWHESTSFSQENTRWCFDIGSVNVRTSRLLGVIRNVNFNDLQFLYVVTPIPEMTDVISNSIPILLKSFGHGQPNRRFQIKVGLGKYLNDNWNRESASFTLGSLNSLELLRSDGSYMVTRKGDQEHFTLDFPDTLFDRFATGDEVDLEAYLNGSAALDQPRFHHLSNPPKVISLGLEFDGQDITLSDDLSIAIPNLDIPFDHLVSVINHLGMTISKYINVYSY